MARLVSCGFEHQSTATGAEGQGYSTAGSPTITKAVRRTGGAALQCTQGASAIWAQTFVAGRNYYARAFVYIKKFPTADTPIIWAGTTGVFSVLLRASDHKLQLWRAGVSDAAAGLSPALELNRWYEVDLRFLFDTGAIDQIEGRLDQTSFASESGMTITDASPSSVKVGIFQGSAGGTVIFDDVIVNDDQGAAANSWPNAGGFHLLLPVADATRDAGWLDGNGSGTTNLWDSINNLPSTAQGNTTGQQGKMIQNAVSTTTQNYDVDVQSYTEGGVPSTDTVRMVQAILSYGNGTNTSSEPLGMELLSNPADASETAGPATSLVAGVWPSGWVVGRTPEVWTPTVTRGTRPRVRAGKRTASTSKQVVTLAGVLVESTPGGGAPQANRQAMYL